MRVFATPELLHMAVGVASVVVAAVVGLFLLASDSLNWLGRFISNPYGLLALLLIIGGAAGLSAIGILAGELSSDG